MNTVTYPLTEEQIAIMTDQLIETYRSRRTLPPGIRGIDSPYVNFKDYGDLWYESVPPLVYECDLAAGEYLTELCDAAEQPWPCIPPGFAYGFDRHQTEDGDFYDFYVNMDKDSCPSEVWHIATDTCVAYDVEMNGISIDVYRIYPAIGDRDTYVVTVTIL